ncbi:MAG: hypothetical protein CMH46_00740 [Muricauda sp.]|nr:hypothetical protein [Allomuricauda sp.]MAU14051.1 hypothetical protein [Allomuricauda sp.]
MALRQKHKNVYFTGKVLNIKEDANDNAKSFRFSEAERNELDLAGIPIQLEHNDKLKVGTIERSWRDDAGQFWVFGAIDKSSVEGTFAKHAIQKKNNKSAYYTGLSLSHVHREYPDGKCEKVPIEVSLCTEPRRANCNIIWTSNKDDTKLQTNKVPYKPVVEQATKNNMSAVTENQTTPQTEEPKEPMQVETPSEPTGKELSEQVYNQFAELMEKEKGQAAKIAALEAQLKKHNESLEEEKKKKAEADAAKGQALMQTFIEHINDLVGPEENTLQNDIEPLIAQPGMNRVMEIVARASKKYKEQSIKLKETQNNLKDKELELKFQTLIKQNVVPQQVVEKASKKRPAPVAQNTVKATTQAAKSFNPYEFNVTGSSSRIAPRAKMNEGLLNAYNQNRGAGINAARRLHKSFQNRPKPTGPMW